ncbi:fork head domain protein [Dictyocaulus viviparus]|uniref:Fork head domain protein n=1 Tax=Dictyocaulus viviparus TaxID=29172 RepID=A0A0D8Y5N1_DICVI|nr:fork head domain protein [Dictyocaulus viviparus]
MSSASNVSPPASQTPLPSSGSLSASSSIGQLGASSADAFMITAESTTLSSFQPASDSEAGEDVTPLSRDRCNTWPLRRSQLDVNAQTSPLIHEQIPEEDGDCCNMPSPVMSDQLAPNSGNSANDLTGDGCVGGTSISKKSTTRRNAWGNLSYADLITQAIMQSPEKRLTLSQVYEWMVQNVPYFRDKGDSNSSAGWKISPYLLIVLMDFIFRNIFCIDVKCNKVRLLSHFKQHKQLLPVKVYMVVVVLFMLSRIVCYVTT